MKRSTIRALVLFVVISAATLSVFAWYYQSALSRPLEFGQQNFLVERGDTLSSIANRLVELEIIEDSFFVRVYARLNRTGSHIEAGEYRFPDSISVSEFVKSMESGKYQVGIKLTIVEGWTFRQMREAINKAPKLEKITSGWSDHQVMEELGYPDLHPEGQFYPDTYLYRLGDNDMTIFRKAFDLMQEQVDRAWENRLPEIEIENRYQALILASIVEKESQAWEEQPEISGVFNNRLRLGMRLQTDPTVIYGIGDEYEGNITRKHLKKDTPYNTYTRYGLPPTPIALPGERAILAAVQPIETESLYFVARGEGRHKFSRTLEEHNAAVRKYILNRKNDD
jgi:UPF0755 protein